SSEYIKGITRWCLWIEDKDADFSKSIPEVKLRLDNIIEYRENGSERGKLGINTPHRFERTLTCENSQLVIPRVSSERREYIPIGYLDSDVIISDAA
ncbi:hypothetical protein L1D34_29610, partial [Vibrio mediterranei]|nr:hypothetical protein [Vibrio mediterranei]